MITPPSCGRQPGVLVSCHFLTEFKEQILDLGYDSSFSYLMLQLDVAFKQSSVGEVLTTLITGIISSCQTHPPKTRIKLKKILKTLDV